MIHGNLCSGFVWDIVGFMFLRMSYYVIFASLVWADYIEET